MKQFLIDKIKVASLVMSLLFTVFLSVAFAQEAGCELSFLDIGAGARPRALGNAFVGIADDANSVYWNPAGITTLGKTEITGMHSSLFFGTKYDYLAVAFPFGKSQTDTDIPAKFGFGVAYIRASTGDIPLTEQGTDTIPGTNYPEIVYNGTASFTSNTGIFSLGTRLFDRFNLALVSRINYIKLANFTGFGYNLGVAFLVPIQLSVNTLKFGILFQDILPVKIKWDNDFSEEVLPTANLGSSFEFRKKILITANLEQVLASGHHPGYGFGLEWRPVQVLPIRFGIEDEDFSTGIGFLNNRFSLDYTIFIHQELPLSHYLSLGVRL
jgi:long-subunit fatty acid transport protein